MFEFTLPLPLVLGVLSGTVLPLLVGLVTTRVTHSGVKAVLLAALSAVAGLLSELVNAVNSGTTYDIGAGLIVALSAFLVGVGIHTGLYKPTEVSKTLQEVGTKDSTRG